MNTLQVKVINRSLHALPQYATSGASGMDLRASIPNKLVLQPLERTLVATGIFIELPQGYEAQVRPRSGLAIKQGLTCLNSPGTIDADYRGEIKVVLINLSNQQQVVNNGDRIAQLVFQKVEQAIWVEVEQIDSTMRGTGGFGHTGKL